MNATDDDWKHQPTSTASELATSDLGDALDVVTLTLLCHPDPERVGEQSLLSDLRQGDGVNLSRLEPDFIAPGGDRRRSLEDPRLSRRPFVIRPSGDAGVELDASATSTRGVWVAATGNREIAEGQGFSAEQLTDGVVLLLASRVVLLLHCTRPVMSRPPSFGMVGESAALVRLRREIERVADLDISVLLRGASGTGKELVARAIQSASRRRHKPYCAVNVAAIPTSLAAAELFGAAKGAFSGADRRRLGYFEQADGGTLFLDEIGEMSIAVQVLLLRALESHEIQPVGSDKPQTVDVRVIAATDADLQLAIAEGRFREPLLHRLAGYEVELPTLSQRRDDIGRLVFHFLRQELEALGETERLNNRGSQRPWVNAEVIARLATLNWPGNVRQLRNVVRQLAVASRGSDEMQVGSRVETLLAEASTGSVASHDAATAAQPAPLAAAPDAPRRRAKTYRDPGDVEEAELLDALRTHQFRVQPTATYLGISRASLYVLIDGCVSLRKASDLTQEDIEAARKQADGSVEATAARLEVSKQGLKMRLKELGLK